jgi:hypothetical protein
MEHGYTMHGYTSVSNEILGIVGNEIKSLGTLPAGYSDSGACDERTGHCSSYEYNFKLDTSAVNQAYYPIILQAKGIKKGSPYRDIFTVRFDPKSKSYELPSALKEAAD